MVYFLFFCVFFFKQKTAYEMRISDWSSDVCSSDLPSSAAVRRPRSCFMSHVDIRSAARPDPDQPMVDIADYVIDAKIDSPEAYDTARYMLLDSLACAMLAMKFDGCVKHLGPL